MRGHGVSMKTNCLYNPQPQYSNRTQNKTSKAFHVHVQSTPHRIYMVQEDERHTNCTGILREVGGRNGCLPIRV